MKRVLLAIALTAGAVVAQADQKTLSIVWPFGMGDTQAQYSRSLVDELNKNQKTWCWRNNWCQACCGNSQHCIGIKHSLFCAAKLLS